MRDLKSGYYDAENRFTCFFVGRLGGKTTVGVNELPPPLKPKQRLLLRNGIRF